MRKRLGAADADGRIVRAADEDGGVRQPLESEGFDVKILREVIWLKKQDEKERDERDSFLHACPGDGAADSQGRIRANIAD